KGANPEWARVRGTARSMRKDRLFSPAALLLRELLEAELLAAYAGLEHETSLSSREDSNAVLIVGVVRGTCLRRHRAYLGGQRQRPVLEVIERWSRLEEDDLRVGLTPELGTDRHLGKRRPAGRFAVLEEHPGAAGAPDADRSFRNGWEDGISNGGVEEAREVRICVLEGRDRVPRFLDGPGRIVGVGGHGRAADEQDECNCHGEHLGCHACLLSVSSP